jgi:hypothetical protein
MDSALATGLRRDPGWTVAYEDTQAVVLTHAASAQAESSILYPSGQE